MARHLADHFSKVARYSQRRNDDLLARMLGKSKVLVEFLVEVMRGGRANGRAGREFD